MYYFVRNLSGARRHKALHHYEYKESKEDRNTGSSKGLEFDINALVEGEFRLPSHFHALRSGLAWVEKESHFGVAHESGIRF
jgi:hypothetical protein